MVVTLPLTLLLLDYWPLGRTAFCAGAGSPSTGPAGPGGAVPLVRLVGEKVPLLALSVIVGVINLVIHPKDAIASLDRLPLLERLANAVVSYGAYLGKQSGRRTWRSFIRTRVCPPRLESRRLSSFWRSCRSSRSANRGAGPTSSLDGRGTW